MSLINKILVAIGKQFVEDGVVATEVLAMSNGDDIVTIRLWPEHICHSIPLKVG